MFCKIIGISKEEAVLKLKKGERFYVGPRITGANLKTAKLLNVQLEQIKEYMRAIDNGFCPEGEFFVAPSNAILYKVRELLGDNYPQIKLAAQGIDVVHGSENTGALTAQQLEELKVVYVVIGHSEKRDNLRLSFQDPRFKKEMISSYINNEMSNQVKLAVDNGFSPVFCVGEKLEVRFSDENDKDYQNIDAVKMEIMAQLRGGLSKVTKEDIEKLINVGKNFVIAYEPVWSINTGKTASPEQAEVINSFIREILIELYGAEIAAKIAIQYGGSVKPENAGNLGKKSNIDGSLVGGASYGKMPDSDKPSIFEISQKNEAERTAYNNIITD